MTAVMAIRAIPCRGNRSGRKHGLRPVCESVLPLTPGSGSRPEGCAGGAPNVPDQRGSSGRGGPPPLALEPSLVVGDSSGFEAGACLQLLDRDREGVADRPAGKAEGPGGTLHAR